MHPMSHMTIITGPERWRRWRLDEKLSVLQEAFAPGAVVSEVARRRELSTALIYNWRRQALAGPAGILPTRIVEDDPAYSAGAGTIADSCVRVALASGTKVEVPFGAPSLARSGIAAATSSAKFFKCLARLHIAFRMGRARRQLAETELL